MTEENKKPRCPKCDSTQIYILRDGSIVCRRCGAETKKEEHSE